MTRTHLLTLLLISTGSVLTGLCLMQERAEPQPSQEARALAVETLPTNTTLPGNQVEQPEHTPIQVLNTPEQRHVATRNTCDVRCHSAGVVIAVRAG